jgi:GDP-4-dehydro-6-deoxy-D-mannose reductase
MNRMRRLIDNVATHSRTSSTLTYDLNMKISMATAGQGPLLITGDHGFVGGHALARWPTAIGLSSLAGGADIRNKSALLDCLSSNPPGAVLHLAALSFVPDSFKAPEATYEVNFLGTLRLLEALAETGFKGRFLFVGTGDAYGMVPVESLPIREEFPLRPRNPYAVSKVAAEALCFQWSQTGPFEVMMARPFNHIGAGQAPSFALSDFARQIAEIGAGKRPPALQVGNIDVSRDFTDVRDVLRAYGLLLAQGRNGEIYNICSGVERSVRSLLERLLELSGVQAEIMNDPTRFRPSDQPRVCSSHEKLSQHTGWQPEVPIDETLLSLYRYWENEIAT